MAPPASPPLRRQSIRVALAATGVVALVYVIIAAGVIAFTTINLTADVDRRITGTIGRIPQGGRGGGDQPFDPGSDPSRPFAPRSFTWTITADGRVLAQSGTPSLPAALLSVTSPVTATINGTVARVAGRSVGSDRVVVAEALDQVADATKGTPLNLSALGALDITKLTDPEQLKALCDVLTGDLKVVGAGAVEARCTGNTGTTTIQLGVPSMTTTLAARASSAALSSSSGNANNRPAA